MTTSHGKKDPQFKLLYSTTIDVRHHVFHLFLDSKCSYVSENFFLLVWTDLRKQEKLFNY